MSANAGESSGFALPAPERLAEILLDAAAAGEFDRELEQARAAITRHQQELGRIDLVTYRILLFDLTLVSTTDRRLQADAGIELLAGADNDAWNAILSSSRIEDMRRLAGEPEKGLELIELLTYSPDPGTRDFAVSELVATGLRLIASGESARTVERLLHASGAREEAYRLEAVRKQRAPQQLSGNLRQDRKEVQLPYRVVAIAGGHAQLRVATSALFKSYGTSVVSIPSSREAVRREREIVHLLRGCDLAVVLVRQITHSTSDQVRKAAEKLGVPVVFSHALSAVAIERLLLEHQR